jgi:hypothetical protein
MRPTIRFSSRLAAVLAAMLAACTLGPTIAEFEPAHRAAGAPTTVRVGKSSVGGELLAASDSGVILLAREGITFIPYRAIRNGVTRGMPADFGLGDAPDREMLRMLRNLSRYPQGVSSELLEKLLAAYRQPSPLVVQ